MTFCNWPDIIDYKFTLQSNLVFQWISCINILVFAWFLVICFFPSVHQQVEAPHNEEMLATINSRDFCCCIVCLCNKMIYLPILHILVSHWKNKYTDYWDSGYLLPYGCIFLYTINEHNSHWHFSLSLVHLNLVYWHSRNLYGIKKRGCGRSWIPVIN